MCAGSSENPYGPGILFVNGMSRPNDSRRKSSRKEAAPKQAASAPKQNAAIRMQNISTYRKQQAAAAKQQQNVPYPQHLRRTSNQSSQPIEQGSHMA